MSATSACTRRIIAVAGSSIIAAAARVRRTKSETARSSIATACGRGSGSDERRPAKLHGTGIGGIGGSIIGGM